MAITLYELQPHARKVRLLAAELGIPLNKVPMDPRIGETRTSEYLAMNPNGRIPTLEDDGFVLWESPAILKYLSAKRPDRGLCGGFGAGLATFGARLARLANLETSAPLPWA
jgi:glutathione S-transferase